SRISAASIKPRQANTWPGLNRSTGITASAIRITSQVVGARRLLVRRAEQRLQPGESPRPPPMLKPHEAQRRVASMTRDCRRGRRVAAACADGRTGAAVMGGDQMPDQILHIRRQLAKRGVALDAKQ